MRRIAGLSALALVALAPAAHANSLPAPSPPPKSVGGVKVTWPATPQYVPGSKITVGIDSAKRKAQLAFLTARGRGRGRKTGRHGSFTVTVPPGDKKVYKLRLKVGQRTYFSWIIATAVVPLTPGFAAPISGDACTGETPNTPVLTLQKPAAAGGEALDATIYNPGPGCIGVPSWLFIWQAADGTDIALNCNGDVYRGEVQICDGPPP